jgi:hypothetical protein
VEGPYAEDSPWNLPIGPEPDYDKFSDRYVATLEEPFGCDPTQYAYTVYEVGPEAQDADVFVWGVFSRVGNAGRDLDLLKDVTVSLPLPHDAKTSRGRDAQIILVRPDTGDEWGFWKLQRQPDGSWRARNGYHYNTNWSGTPPTGFHSRGAGVPYLAGLVRPAEIRAGRIGHALAFGTLNPNASYVYPATKSDGQPGLAALPEGARLQLDPALGRADFDRWGLDRAGRVMARALQEYGMILVDGSGHTKIYVEDVRTANWGNLLDKDTVRPIPFSAFRVLDLEAPARPERPADLKAERAGDTVTLTWSGSPGATRYRVQRRERPDAPWLMLDRWVLEPRYTDTDAPKPGGYMVQAVSHNGVSEAAEASVGSQE